MILLPIWVILQNPDTLQPDLFEKYGLGAVAALAILGLVTVVKVFMNFLEKHIDKNTDSNLEVSRSLEALKTMMEAIWKRK